MPKEIQDQFFTSNYYIEIPINEELCNKVAQDIAADCTDIVDFEKMSSADQEAFLELNFSYDPNNYYDKKLCAYHRSQYFKDREATLDNMLEPEDSTELDMLFEEGKIEEELFS